ncbi:MAG: LytTR family transcriptional regulator DNA-binding domain-containing protein [Bacteroidetes bacterium]|nr:LytTR family transcriptional regulator DNA-binding domain-containing protein [Bacteroidota bacterium]
MKIAILEDEFIVVKDLQNRLKQMGYQVVASFGEGEELIAFISQNKVDLLLVDIQLKGKLNGIETLQIVNKMMNIPAIFITAQADKATFNDAKGVKPAAYLLKPYNNFDLQTTIELAIENHLEIQTENEQASNYVVNDTIFVRGKDRFQRIQLNTILYMEAAGNYTDIITADQKYVVTSKLGQLEEQLNQGPFFRCHRSYMVNLHAVDGFDDANIFINSQKVPISKGSKKAFLEKLRVI